MTEQIKTEVLILMGSESDWKGFVEPAKLGDIFNAIGITWHPSVFSVHRHGDQIDSFLAKFDEDVLRIIIATAGWAAALAGGIVYHLQTYPVLGVPLPSEGFPDAQDATLAMTRVPPPLGVPTFGFGKVGLRQAAVFACQTICTFESGSDRFEKLRFWVDKELKKKPVVMDARDLQQGDTREA